MVGDISISDVFGLGKMAEVIGRGIGTLYKPHHLKKLSDVRAKQIEASSNAASLKGEVKAIEYTDDSLKLIYQHDTLKEEVPKELVNAAHVRFIEREIRRQINIESTIQKAALNFDDEEMVTNEEVSQEWIDRYFDSIQDISAEDLQSLWGKVLAGEVKKPSSFSLRTLDLLKNMTTEEAEIFAKVAKISVNLGTTCLVINDAELLKHYELQYSDILLLDDIGLINSEATLTYELLPQKKDITTGFLIGNLVGLIFRIEDSPHLKFDSYPLTKSGVDLSVLVEKEPDIFYEPILQKLASYIKRKDIVEFYVSPGKGNQDKLQYDLNNMRQL